MGRKHVITGFFVFVLLTIAVLTGWGNVHSNKHSLNISELIAKENINDISLTIYYLNPLTLTRYPLSAEDLISFTDVHKIVINGNDLKKHFELFKRINDGVLMPVKKKSRVDARIYYVLESKTNGKLFDVTMWGKENSMFVNGLEVKGNEIFYDVIRPFLPEDAV
ncbi:hypothetical protein [Paenibacillus typhae]|uniref:Uncharacterized protein n=1 Tax=Paenibacillus typhae TaxID=1174501 RepID=A0A1G8YXZ4_9BACL|nr:hypothetical protein [Paenibacillus typhae]SDK07698.1 hypothetical protein SAMN05216192_1319 [Paenibacillus typhae]